jgi:hypothetical protein
VERQTPVPSALVNDPVSSSPIRLLRDPSTQRLVLRDDIRDEHARGPVGVVQRIVRNAGWYHEAFAGLDRSRISTALLDHDRTLSDEANHFTRMGMPPRGGVWRPRVHRSNGFKSRPWNVAALNNLPVSAFARRLLSMQTDGDQEDGDNRESQRR